MTPQDRLVKKLDDLYDEWLASPRNSRRRAELESEMKGLATAVVEVTRLSVEDLRELVAERAEARRAGERMPALLTWLSHRGVPSPRNGEHDTKVR